MKFNKQPFDSLLARFKPKSKQAKTADIHEMKPVDCSYHKMSLDELCHEFSTSVTRGLTIQQAAETLAKNGPNLLAPPQSHYIRKILGYLFGGFCSLLWIGSLICFLAWKPIGQPPDPTNLGLAILLLLVIALQAAFEAFQDWSSSKVMKSIKGMMAADATVIRDGAEVKIPAENLVVGDLILLTYGNKVPADLRLIESMDLKFDRAMLTGESEAVEGKPMHFHLLSLPIKLNIFCSASLITSSSSSSSSSRSRTVAITKSLKMGQR